MAWLCLNMRLAFRLSRKLSKLSIIRTRRWARWASVALAMVVLGIETFRARPLGDQRGPVRHAPNGYQVWAI